MVLLFLTAFGLALLIALSHTQLSTLHLSSSDKTYYRFDSIENAFKEIFYRESGIRIKTSNNSVTLEENLPQATNFLNDTLAFKNFAQNFSDIQVRIDISALIPRLPLIISPHNITYQHLDYGDGRYEVVPTFSANVTGYDVLINISDHALFGYSWSSGCDSIPCPGTLAFHIVVVNTTHQCLELTENLDPSTMSCLQMDVGDEQAIKTCIDNPAKFNITSDIPIYVKNRVDLQQTNEKIHVKYPPNIILVNNSVFGSWKNDTVVIA
ncbi:MAG: hypothetical protein QMD12_01630 [Candidatus Aenigmarchaeota archaeon]|nr:hypothetical protein [Candidatus Aenigmarchaeota archaeon]